MILVFFMGIYATVKLNQINRISLNIDQVDDAAIKLAEQLSELLFSQVGFGKKFLISRDRDFYVQFKDKEHSVWENFNRINGLDMTSEIDNILHDTENLYHRFVEIFAEEVRESGQRADFVNLTRQFKWDETTDRINRNLKEIIRLSRSQRDEKAFQSNQISAKVLRVAGITAGFIILVGILMSFLNTRSINRPLRLLQDKTKEIAKGKFGEIANIASPPEVKELADHFNTMCRRLKELEEMKLDFISHVSHELRTPLTAIKEASSMLLEGVYAGSPEKEHDLLIITQEECERLIGSVNRILDLSRMEARMMTFYLRECRLEPLMRKAVKKTEPIARKKNIRVELKLSGNLPPVKIDEAHIEQVFENLIGNALKFAREYDTVTISTLFSSENGNIVRVSVADTGPGIPANDLVKIFDKFQRIENGIETVRGTGLGLSIAKHIISSHGGHIWVESKEGEGSTFYFTLPASLPLAR
jgi:two-component system sensor histidine kinase GlrK